MQPEEMVGHVLGHYRIINALGYGGTATVFLAEDIHLHREVALKVFQPESSKTEEFLRRFEREARVLAQLDHPNILPVYDYGEQGNIAYLVMPRMAGGSLKDRLRQQHIISPAETIHLISQVLDALQYAHDRGLIHRDIKPGNLLFKIEGQDGRRERLLLSDFGLVKVLTGAQNIPLPADLTHQSAPTITGTPDYMAPEQILSKATQASDIYSIGVVLYEMLTGERPFHTDNYVSILMKHLHEQPRPLRALNPRIPPALEAVVLRAMAKEEERRYQKPFDLHQALEWAVTGKQSAIEQRDLYATTPTAQVLPSSSTSDPGNITPDKQPRVAETHKDTIIPAHLSAGPSARHSKPSISPSAVTLDVDAHTPHPPISQPVRTSKRPTLATTLLLLTLVVAVGLGGLLYAQNFNRKTPAIPQVTPTTPSKGGSAATSSISTTPGAVPPTTTDCPSSNTARPAIMASLVLGARQNIIYIVNEGTHDHPTAGVIKRREASAGARGVEITRLPGDSIREAQVSGDGQWVLFTAHVAEQDQLRMVRVDGQGLQTLYCAPANDSISHTQWSFHQQLVIFNVSPDSKSSSAKPIAYLLDITNGQLQPELEAQTNLVYYPVTWLDKTHVYMTATTLNTDTPAQNVYILDTQKGAHQHDNNLQTITTGPCGSFDSNYDSTQLLISTCQLAPSSGKDPGLPTGPSTITIQPAQGGQAKTVITVKQAVAMLRTVTSTTLLLLIENHSGDSSQNGLWKMNINGTGLTRLTTDTQNQQSLCPFTQYTWSNVSLDENLYALQEHDPKTNTYKMYYGSMKGGAPFQFANVSDGTQLLLAGWTSL